LVGRVGAGEDLESRISEAEKRSKHLKSKTESLSKNWLASRYSPTKQQRARDAGGPTLVIASS
jgi:hypothetical protein